MPVPKKPGPYLGATTTCDALPVQGADGLLLCLCSSARASCASTTAACSKANICWPTLKSMYGICIVYWEIGFNNTLVCLSVCVAITDVEDAQEAQKRPCVLIRPPYFTNNRKADWLLISGLHCGITKHQQAPLGNIEPFWFKGRVTVRRPCGTDTPRAESAQAGLAQPGNRAGLAQPGCPWPGHSLGPAWPSLTQSGPGWTQTSSNGQ